MGPRFLLAALCLFAPLTAPSAKQHATAPPSPPAPPALVNLSMRAPPLELIGEIGLQTRVPIGIILGQDANALCGSKGTFVFLGDDPRDALDAIARQVHFTLNQEDGVLVLAAPDITPHQRAVLDHRFPIYRTGGKSIVQMISAHLSGALWMDSRKPAPSGYGGSIYHSPDAPKISLPPVLHNVTAQEIADLAIKAGPRGIYLSHIHPSRVASPGDLSIQISSYGDPQQLKLNLRCQP